MGNNDNDITALIRKSQKGDAAAMEELLRSAYTPVSYQCRRFLKTGADAEDMTQEILLLIYTKIDTLNEPAAFWGWLGRMTANRCKNALTRTHEDLPILEDEEGNSVLDSIESGDRQTVPEEAFDNAETARMIGRIVDALPEAQRNCVLLYYYDEMSVKEIADVLDTSENTVKSRLNYARRTIKDNVLDYEKKQGIRLHSLAPIPLLLYFLRMEAEAGTDTRKAAQAVSKAMEQGAANPAAKAVSHAIKGISIKTAAVAGAGLLLIGGAVAGIVTIINTDKEETAETSTYLDAKSEDISETESAEQETSLEEDAEPMEEPLFPKEALSSLPYTGDTEKCAMTMEQAEAFAEAIDTCISESREGGYSEPFCRAALFDAGNGIPALFVSWGEDVYYANSAYSGGMVLEHTEDNYLAYTSRIYCWDGQEASVGAGGGLGKNYENIAVTDKGLLTDTGFYTFTDGIAELSHTYEDFFLSYDTSPSVDKFKEYIAEHGVYEGGYDFNTLTEDKWQVYQEADYDNWPDDGYSWLVLNDDGYGSLISALDGVFLSRSEAEAAGKDMAWYMTWQDWNLGNGPCGAHDVSYTWTGDWMEAEELAALLRNADNGIKESAPENTAASMDGDIKRTTIDSQGYDIEIWYEAPVFAEDTDGYAKINAEYEARLDAFVNDESGELADLWEIVEGNPPVSESYRYTVSADIKSQTAKYVSVKQEFYMYLGGMDGVECYYDNFRTDSGESLLLTDFLGESESQIKEMIVDALVQTDPYIKETGALDEITDHDSSKFDFYISDGHIYICFTPYELYGMTYGNDAPVEVELPAELKAEWK